LFKPRRHKPTADIVITCRQFGQCATIKSLVNTIYQAVKPTIAIGVLKLSRNVKTQKTGAGKPGSGKDNSQRLTIPSGLLVTLGDIQQRVD